MSTDLLTPADFDGRDLALTQFCGPDHGRATRLMYQISEEGKHVCVSEAELRQMLDAIERHKLGIRITAKHPPACRRCNDRGVIDTGNNDYPCECPAGDIQLFNTQYGVETGAQIKARRFR